jgi:hypothetical protein
MRGPPPKDPLVLSGTVASAPYAMKIVRKYNWPMFRLFLVPVLEDGYFAEVTDGSTVSLRYSWNSSRANELSCN